jgi:hypothetical protein
VIIFFFLIIFVPISILAALKTAGPGDKHYLIKLVVGTWLTLGPVVALVNAWMPFSGGGDDFTYYQLASKSINSIAEIFNFSRFAGLMEQPGYPWILSLLHSFTGHDLLAYKFLNLFFFILLALTWYRIGLLLETRLFARRMIMVVLMLTPLWFYIFILRKDMSITLLQSFFLMTAIQIWSGAKLKPVFGFSLSTLALILLRTSLIVQNGAVLMGSLTLRAYARGARGRKLMPFFIGALLLIGFFPIVINPKIMELFGIYSEQRLIGSAAMIERGLQLGARSEMNRLLFPLVYLFSETAGLTQQAWSEMGERWLRGLLALPWIFVLVPFFLLGIVKTFQAPTSSKEKLNRMAGIRASRFVATPWSAVVMFVLSSIAISWVVGDTTRWRIPDMPMVAAIALLGWSWTSPSRRKTIWIVWFLGSAGIFALYYSLRG